MELTSIYQFMHTIALSEAKEFIIPTLSSDGKGVADDDKSEYNKLLVDVRFVYAAHFSHLTFVLPLHYLKYQGYITDGP